MTALEMLKELSDHNVLYMKERRGEENVYEVEDCESYAGYAVVYFDNDGNCIKVEG